MQSMKIVALIAVAMFLVSAALAIDATPEDRGKALFNDTKLGGGTSGRSCGICHPDGEGLEGVTNKKEWKTPCGQNFKVLEERINLCVTKALEGTALNVKSAQMTDLVSYLKTIKPKEEKAPKKKRIPGC